jgi:hypothetical protein
MKMCVMFLSEVTSKQAPIGMHESDSPSVCTDRLVKLPAHAEPQKANIDATPTEPTQPIFLMDHLLGSDPSNGRTSERAHTSAAW